MIRQDLIQEAICFYSDYYSALAEITRVTSKRIIIIMGHRILNDVLIDNAQITIEMLDELGWELQTRYMRTIRGKRIHRKIAFGNNSQGGTIDTESILIFVPSDV